MPPLRDLYFDFEVHPLIIGLVITLPDATAKRWTVADKERWLQTASMILDLVYTWADEDADPEEVIATLRQTIEGLEAERKEHAAEVEQLEQGAERAKQKLRDRIQRLEQRDSEAAAEIERLKAKPRPQAEFTQAAFKQLAEEQRPVPEPERASPVRTKEIATKVRPVMNAPQCSVQECKQGSAVDRGPFAGLCLDHRRAAVRGEVLTIHSPSVEGPHRWVREVQNGAGVYRRTPDGEDADQASDGASVSERLVSLAAEIAGLPPRKGFSEIIHRTHPVDQTVRETAIRLGDACGQRTLPPDYPARVAGHALTAEWVASELERRGWSQMDLAAHANVALADVKALEKRQPPIRVGVQIATALRATETLQPA